MRACLVMLDVDEDFRRVWPIHFLSLKDVNFHRLLSSSNLTNNTLYVYTSLASSLCFQTKDFSHECEA